MTLRLALGLILAATISTACHPADDTSASGAGGASTGQGGAAAVTCKEACAEGFVCQDAADCPPRCQCASDAACGAGARCVGSTDCGRECAEIPDGGCLVAADCGGKLQCVAQKCGCLTNADCGVGAVCHGAVPANQIVGTCEPADAGAQGTDGGATIQCGPGGEMSLADFCAPGPYAPGALCAPTLEQAVAHAFTGGKATDMTESCGLIGVESAGIYGTTSVFYDATTHALVGAQGPTDCNCGPCQTSSWFAGKIPDASCKQCTTCGSSPYKPPCAADGGAGAGGAPPACMGGTSG